MSAPTTTTLQTLFRLLPDTQAPLQEPLLKAIRAVIIQKPPIVEIPEDVSTTFFARLLQTAHEPEILHSHRAIAADTISAWLIRARTNPTLLPPFPAAFEKLCDIFLGHFDDATAGLTKALKDLLANTLSLAALPALNATQDVVRILATRGLFGVSVGEGRKGGYYALEIAVKRGVGAGWVFEKYAGGAEKLVVDMLGNLVDRNLGPAIGKVVVALLAARRKEVIDAGKDEKEWYSIWERPLRTALKSEELRQRVVIYVLPGVLKSSAECFRMFSQSLGLGESDDIKDDGSLDLGALLCCLKAGKELGFVGEIGDESEPSNSSKTPVIRLASRFVSPLLAHALPHIRVSALNLVVQSPSITRPFTPGALNIIKTALPALHTESNAEVRDLTISALRNLIERVAFSSFSSEKELKNLQQKLRSGNRPTPDDIRKMIQLDSRVGDAKEFCVWYIGFLEMLLRPGSNYQRCITAFRSLGFLIKSGVDASLVEYAFAVAPGSGSITADGGIFKKGLLKWPGFSKDIRIFGPGIKRVLLEGMFNAFDDVRTMSAEILRFDPQWNKTDMLAFLGRGLKAMNESGRARDADGVARTVALVFEVAKRGEISFDQNDKLWGFEISGDGLGVVRWVLEVLEEYLSVSAADLQRAVKERPIHGIFASLGMILQNGGDIYTTEKDLLAWKEINERIFKACEDVWRLTKAPLCFDSPEGHVPSDIDEDDEGINTQTVMSYSWRAVKESSSLLGLILGTSPASTLASTDFERCGKQLLQQLADIRHRGAFSAVSPSFVALCTRCFESSDATLRELPRTWLRGSLESILEKSNAITRRSAGLPYLIMGVLASEIDPKRPLMSSTFARFVEIATLPATASKNGEKMDLPQVHALNCLKFLFTDARVSQVVVPYIGQGLELAVSCFGSEIWAIRNCGVMLFTALTNRLFGMRRSRNDYASSITTRYFFEKYRSVRTVLLKNLREKVGGLEGGDAVSVEMVYPALSLIARMEVDPGYDGMEEFREPIEGCMKCSIWKVREMAARAYTALVGPKDVVRVVQELMEVGPENQNKLHGNLCAVRALLERRVRQAVLEENGDQVWKLISETFAARFGDLVLNNRCAVTKVVALQLLTLHSDKFGLTDWIKEYVETCGFRRTREIRTSSVVGRSFFKEHLVAFILTFLRQFDDSKFPAAVTSLFADEDEEINLYAVNQLLSLSELPALQKESHERLWNIVDTHPWHLLGASALSLLSRLPVIATQERFDSLLALVQTPPTEPIKEAALTLLGPITAQLPADSGALQTLLLHLQKAAHDDEEYTLRTAALSSLTALAPLLKLGGNTPSPDSLIPAYALVYDLLNDDDGDIRLAAAELTQRILPGDAQILLLPLAAAEKLALTLPGYFAGSRALLEVAVGKVVGEDAARVAWEAAVKKDIILFQREKQNLWVDAVGVVEVWGVVAELVLARGGEGKEEVVERVRAWVGEAEELVGGMGENVVLGWASDEDVVVFLARVRVARRVLGR